MISFEDIDKPSLRYDILMKYLNVAHNHIYYRNFHILNPENIPPKGTPTLVIANHQNGMMDAMAILHTLYKDGRQPVFIARGDIFKKDTVAKILKSIKILPVFRNRDGGRDDVKKDLEIFNRAECVLKNGSTLVIFPEAGHQAGHFMSTFKKGFSRIAFGAEEMCDFKLGVQILPLNIHYSNYFNFRSDLMITCGKPFTYEEFFELYKSAPNKAYLALNEKARNRVKELTPDIDIPEYYDEIEMLTQMMSEPLVRYKGLKVRCLPNQKDAMMTIIDSLRQFRATKPEDFENLMLKTRNYSSLLQSTKLYDWIINKEISKSKTILCLILMIITLPFALFGFINNLIPFGITQHFTRKIKDPMLQSTFQYAVGGVVSFPLWYIIMLLVVSLLSKSFIFGLIYVLAAALTGLFANSYKKAVAKLIALIRARRIKRTKEYSDLCDLNNEIVDTMENILF